MVTKSEIKKAILRAAGDPEAGLVADLADQMADNVLALIQPNTMNDKEVRVQKPAEIR